MAKKTLALRHKAHDEATSTRRQLLYWKRDERDIRYDYDPVPDTAPPKEENSLPGPASTATAAMSASAAVPAPASAPAPTVTSIATRIEDVPVTAKEIVVTVVAQKLNKPSGEIALDKSVKALVQGKSTLQNEIVGDLEAEFGNLPDKAEELTIAALCEQLQASPSFTGQLKKTSMALTTRMFSLKMPAGFNASKARTYLEERWGIGSGRQSSIFFLASTMQPPARFGSESDAQAFFDSVVSQYALANSLTLSAASAAAASGDAGAGVVLDSKAMALLAQDQELHRQVGKNLAAKKYGLDLMAGERAALKAQKIIDALQEQLDHLTSEFGDDFANGVRPKFSAAKMRRFDSSWNWVMQDLLESFFGILRQGTDGEPDHEWINRAILIANRSTPRLLRVIDDMLGRDYSAFGEHSTKAKDFLSSIKSLCEPGATIPFAAYREEFNMAPRTEITPDGQLRYRETIRPKDSPPPEVSLKTNVDGLGWDDDEALTNKYLSLIQQVQEEGVDFRNKNILVTGASPGSIGAEVVRGLLVGGACVIVTTSSYSSTVTRWYQQLYMSHGSSGSSLIVLPFNQGSQQDIDSLTAYLYDPAHGLGLDLDAVVPFAAISENGREIDGIDARSELAHRIMLTNTVRLLGAISKQKRARGFTTRPAQILLPLSPNHGVFGNDGLYAESKIGLETLFERWHSENWSSYLSICGAVIGWTRGTGLMTDNDIVACEIEKAGMRTFSQREMAFYLLVLMCRPIVKHNEVDPIYADIAGGMSNVPKLKERLTQIRERLGDECEVRKAIATERALEEAANGSEAGSDHDDQQVLPQANLDLHFPDFLDWDTEIASLHRELGGMVDLDRVVVIAGFAEVGPWGNARTRWEIEAYGTFTLDGCIEMAWIMGLIKNHSGPLAGIAHYTGWVDAKTLKPVHDSKIKEVYETQILEHSGIRLIEPTLDEGYDPKKKQILQEIVLEEDLAPFTATKDLALEFQREHGDLVDVFEIPGGDEYTVRLKKGATLMVPRAFEFNRTVAGQIPAGWDARTYGITEEIISQVDRVTLFALISTVEALLSAGVTDFYEIYRYIHVSEVGNCVGSGLGGQISLKRMYKTRFADKPVANDVLQETFINTTAAWINMLVLSACGPIRTPVGACATSIESLETGYETIVSGRAKLCLVGGFDDMTEAPSFEFANMKATSNADAEMASGRAPQEMCRPTSSTRNGFMEAQGGGVQVATSASLALEMGLPIHGIIAWVGTSSDKIGRSIPAPGQGILTNAREVRPRVPSPLLNISYRKTRLERRLKQIQTCLAEELAAIQEDSTDLGDEVPDHVADEFAPRRAFAERHAAQQTKEALNSFGNSFYADLPDISPLRGSLAVWGLTIDDLDVASFHGTSTVKNDINETTVIQSQLAHLGRNDKKPILGIFQKNLTGHSKGGAGAWMLNGCLQVLQTGLVPGNRNADNVDAALEKNDLIIYPNKSIQTPGVRAFSVTSFGFGQKGAQAIGIHSKYLFATLKKEMYTSYVKRAKARQRRAYKFFQKGLATNKIFEAKEHAPYSQDQEKRILLDPKARVTQHRPGWGYAYEEKSVATWNAAFGKLKHSMSFGRT